MRRNDRAVTDPARIAEVLEACQVCRLGLIDKGQAYVVPMNYGYCYEEGALTLYLHCAPEGRRLGLLEENPNVGFEMDRMESYTGEGDIPCTYSCRYASLIGTGRAERLETAAEKMDALARIMRHVAGREFSFTEKMAEPVVVLRIKVNEFSCKERQ